MAKELDELKESPKAEIHIDLLRTTLKNIWNEQMPTRSTSTQIDDQKKDHIDPERPRLKGTAPNNYRPIMCLPMMWKILTAQIRFIPH